MQRCKRCNGTKRIAPMGGIYRDCTACHGIGMVKAPVPPEKAKVVENPESEPEKDLSGLYLIDETPPHDVLIEQTIASNEQKKGRNKSVKPYQKPAL